MHLKITDCLSARYPILALKSATRFAPTCFRPGHCGPCPAALLRVTFYGTFALRFLDAPG
jgi:hypothetical protein